MFVAFEMLDIYQVIAPGVTKPTMRVILATGHATHSGDRTCGYAFCKTRCKEGRSGGQHPIIFRRHDR